jgi:hypothetical protein
VEKSKKKTIQGSHAEFSSQWEQHIITIFYNNFYFIAIFLNIYGLKDKVKLPATPFVGRGGGGGWHLRPHKYSSWNNNTWRN